MALPYTFSTNTTPTGGQLDSCLNALGAMGVISTVAVGTNAITLTPNSNQPTVSVYINNSLFSFAAAATSTGNVTVLVGSLAALPLYLPSGVKAGSGSVVNGTFYIIAYQSALNSGNGGFQIMTQSSFYSAGRANGLNVSNDNGTPSTKIDITAGQTILVNTSTGFTLAVTSPSVVINLATTGANGMDTGSRPTNGWVYTYLISNGTTTAGLATATSPTSGNPTMPAGYTYQLYCGAMYCDGSQNLLRSNQNGANAQYQITASTNTATTPIAASGTAGTWSLTTPTLTNITVSGNGHGTPLTAGEIFIVATNSWKTSSPTALMVAPSTAWGGANNGPSGSNGAIYPVAINDSTDNISVSCRIVLEAPTIAWASAGAAGAVGVLGWRDYWVTG